jgi:hypothetical protein
VRQMPGLFEHTTMMEMFDGGNPELDGNESRDEKGSAIRHGISGIRNQIGGGVHNNRTLRRITNASPSPNEIDNVRNN